MAHDNTTQTITIQEDLATGFRVDREARMIYDVCLLGPESKNGYKYKASVIQEATARYDRKPVYFNHPSNGKRDVRDLAGSIANPRFQGGKLFGDIRAIGKGGDMLMDVAESNVDGIGMSHVAEDCVVRTGKIVESIGKVKSVDLVDGPATTKTLKESTLELQEQLKPLFTGKKPVLTRLKEIYEACGETFNPDDHEMPKATLAIEGIEDIREAAKSNLAVKRLVDEYDALQKKQWAREAIQECKIPENETNLKLLLRCESKEVMVEHGKVLKEAIDAAKPAAEVKQPGRQPAKDGKTLSVDTLVSVFKKTAV